MVVLVTLASAEWTVGGAGASALAQGSLTSSGYTAVCNVTYQVETPAASSEPSDWDAGTPSSAPSGGHGRSGALNSYQGQFHGHTDIISFQFYCNTDAVDPTGLAQQTGGSGGYACTEGSGPPGASGGVTYYPTHSCSSVNFFVNSGMASNNDDCLDNYSTTAHTAVGAYVTTNNSGFVCTMGGNTGGQTNSAGPGSAVGSSGGFSSSSSLYCIDPNYPNSFFGSNYTCPTGPPLSCKTDELGGIGGTSGSCLIQSQIQSAAAPSEPSVQWAGNPATLPPPALPTVTCSDDLNPNTGAAQFHSSASDSTSGVTYAYSWAFGDGGTAAVSNPLHTYSSASEAAGGWQAVVTVTATGDGVASSGQVTASCAVSVSLEGTSAGAGNGSSASGAPQSCSFWDVICAVKAAAAWLFVPDSSFFSTWQSFLSTMETKVPFAYVYAAATWAGTFSSSLQADVTAGCIEVFPSGYGIGTQPTQPGQCSQGLSGLSTAVQYVVGGGLIMVLALGLWSAVRTTIAEH